MTCLETSRNTTHQEPEGQSHCIGSTLFVHQRVIITRRDRTVCVSTLTQERITFRIQSVQRTSLEGFDIRNTHQFANHRNSPSTNTGIDNVLEDVIRQQAVYRSTITTEDKATAVYPDVVTQLFQRVRQSEQTDRGEVTHLNREAGDMQRNVDRTTRADRRANQSRYVHTLDNLLVTHRRGDRLNGNSFAINLLSLDGVIRYQVSVFRFGVQAVAAGIVVSFGYLVGTTHFTLLDDTLLDSTLSILVIVTTTRHVQDSVGVNGTVQVAVRITTG